MPPYPSITCLNSAIQSTHNKLGQDWFTYGLTWTNVYSMSIGSSGIDLSENCIKIQVFFQENTCLQRKCLQSGSQNGRQFHWVNIFAMHAFYFCCGLKACRLFNVYHNTAIHVILWPSICYCMVHLNRCYTSLFHWQYHPSIHNRYTAACLWWQFIGCLVCIQNITYLLPL